MLTFLTFILLFLQASHPSQPNLRLWKQNLDAGAAAYQARHYAEAEKLISAALAEAEKMGVRDIRRAETLNKMAAVYAAQGKHAQAEPLYRRSLSITQVVNGPQHKNVGTILQSLGDLYQALGNYPAADSAYRQALAIREKALGFEHPDVAATLESFAALLRRMKRGKDAHVLEERARYIRDKQAGRKPPELKKRR